MKRWILGSLVLVVSLAVLGLGKVDAAIVLDAAGEQAFLGGGIFYVPTMQIGPGNASNSFLQLRDVSNDGANTLEKGFNTTHGSPIGWEDVTTSTALLLTDVPTLTIGGTLYREFALSIQETVGTGPSVTVSLDAFL